MESFQRADVHAYQLIEKTRQGFHPRGRQCLFTIRSAVITQWQLASHQSPWSAGHCTGLSGANVRR